MHFGTEFWAPNVSGDTIMIQTGEDKVTQALRNFVITGIELCEAVRNFPNTPGVDNVIRSYYKARDYFLNCAQECGISSWPIQKIDNLREQVVLGRKITIGVSEFTQKHIIDPFIRKLDGQSDN